MHSTFIGKEKALSSARGWHLHCPCHSVELWCRIKPQAEPSIEAAEVWGPGHCWSPLQGCRGVCRVAEHPPTLPCTCRKLGGYSGTVCLNTPHPSPWRWHFKNTTKGNAALAWGMLVGYRGVVFTWKDPQGSPAPKFSSPQSLSRGWRGGDMED